MEARKASGGNGWSRTSIIGSARIRLPLRVGYQIRISLARCSTTELHSHGFERNWLLSPLLTPSTVRALYCLGSNPNGSFKLTPRDHRRVVSTYDNHEVLSHTGGSGSLDLTSNRLTSLDHQADVLPLPFKDQARVVAKTRCCVLRSTPYLVMSMEPGAPQLIQSVPSVRL